MRCSAAPLVGGLWSGQVSASPFSFLMSHHAFTSPLSADSPRKHGPFQPWRSHCRVGMAFGNIRCCLGPSWEINMIRVSCPKCKAVLQADDQHAGKVIACSTCKTSLKLPQVQAAPSPSPSVGAASSKASPPPPPAAVWHFVKNGKKQGPVTAQQLRGLVAPSDLVWKEGFPEWIPASTIPNLLPSSPRPTASSPPPVVHDVSPGVTGKISPSSSPKDPILMAVLSFFIPWLGQLVIGQVAKAIVMFLLTPMIFGLFVIATLGMGLVVWPFIGLIAVIDAYLLAKKLKEGRAISAWEVFGIESAPSLAMPDLPPTGSGGKPVVSSKPRPPGLVGSAIGMLFVSGLAMMITLLLVLAIFVDARIPAAQQILIALSFIHNAWVIFTIMQTLRMRRYAFAITAPLLVMGSWAWLALFGIHIGLTVMGILGGISVGIWSLGVLRQPEVRAAFMNQYDPLETFLPMAKETIQNQSPNLGAIKGLAKQLMGNKIALGIVGFVLLALLVVPLFSFFGLSQQKSKFMGEAPTAASAQEDEAKLKKAVAEGDALWDEGVRANARMAVPIKDIDKDGGKAIREASEEARKKFDSAFEKYMIVVNSSQRLRDRDVMAKVYGRVIDQSLSMGNKSMAKEVAMKALRGDILPIVKNNEASPILDAARRAVKTEEKEAAAWIERQEKR